MEKNSNCPACDFDFSSVKPQENYFCGCGKYVANIFEDSVSIYSLSRDYACGYFSGVDLTDEVFEKLRLDKINKSQE